MVKVDTAQDDKLEGHEEDSRNIAKKISDNKFTRASQSTIDARAAEMSAAEEAGEGDRSMADMTPEERREALAAGEEAGQQNPGWSFDSKEDSPYQGNDLKSMLLRMRGVKKTGATTGVAASIFFVGGILISMATGSSFWTALEKNLTNDASDDARINSVLHRAFNNMIAVDACAKPGLKCKMKTMAKEQVKKFRDGLMKITGDVIGKDGNPTRGSPAVDPKDGTIDPDKLQEGERVNAKSITFSDGFVAKSVDAFNTHLDTNIGMRDLATRALNPLTADFVHGKFGEMLAEKFGVSKAKATPEEKKTDNAKEAAKAATEEAGKKASSSKAEVAMRILLSTPAQLGQVGLDYACTAYNVARIATGAVKAKWAVDLARFAWPFLRLISKMQDGSITDQDFQELEDRLMQLVAYLPPSRATELKDKITSNTLSDVDKNTLESFGVSTDNLDDVNARTEAVKQVTEITDKNAFDSQALRAAFYGDTTELTNFTKKFSVGIVGSTTLGVNYILQLVQGWATFGFGGLKEGKQNIKSICRANKALGAVMLAGGIADTGKDVVACVTAITNPASAIDCGKKALTILGQAAVQVGILYAISHGVVEAVTAAVIAEAPSLPPDNLQGPAAGDALASGIALVLSSKAMSSGAKPAMSTAAVNQYLSSTQEYYNQYGDEIAYYEARQDPLNVNSRYSFLGQIVSSLNPNPTAPGQQTSAFSYMANIFGVVSGMVGNTAQALHSQPSLITLNQANLNSRTGNGKCPSDEEKNQSGIICDRTSGRAVMTVSKRVLQWAAEDATGKTDHLSEAIDWMSRPQSDVEKQYGGGTQDETCEGVMSTIMDALTLEWGNLGKCSDSGEKASIDDQGKPVAGSQYEKFVQYCAKRQLEVGSTDIDQGTGSIKEQAWHDGTQCGLTYDCHNTASTTIDEDKPFDPSCDQNIGSQMMDYFTYYYNMCYVQYATANNATDCTNDNPPDGGGGADSSSANSDCGDGTRASIYACALQFDPYTYGPDDHAAKGTVAWYKNFKANPPTDPNALKLDCSSLVMASLVAAFGQDVPNMIASGTFTGDKKYWQSIPKDQAERGDVIVQSSHVEIIKDNDKAKQYFTTFGAHTDNAPVDKQISESGYSYNDVTVGTFRYVGPGVGTGSGNLNV